MNTQMYPGRTVRIQSLNTVEVTLSLGFGVHLQKVVRLDGVDPLHVPEQDRDAAQHCLVVLLGGKRLLVQVNYRDDNVAAVIPGRVYLDERVSPSCRFLAPLPGAPTEKRLDVVAFFTDLAARGFPVEEVRRTLNAR